MISFRGGSSAPFASVGLLIVFLAFLLLTGLLPSRSEVVDLVTLEVLPGLSIRPLHPVLRGIVEPVAGPLMVLLGLPFSRILAWLVWGLIAWVALRTARSHWRGRRWRGLRYELVGFLGWYFPLALLPVPLYWLAWVSKDTMKRLTPLGLPLAVLLGVWASIYWTAAPGKRRRAWLVRSRRFIGGLGLSLLILALGIAVQPLSSLGSRLLVPEDVIVADFHAHSDRSRDALLDAGGRLALFHRHGVEMSAVTEHRSAPRNPADPSYLEQHVAIARGEGYDMLLLPGREFTTHRLHLVILGSEREYDNEDYVILDTRGGMIRSDDYDWERLIRDVHADGGYVVVPHWWTPLTRGRVDWRRLVAAGADGFEIAWAGDRAPRHLVRAWREAGMVLLAASDYHGYRKTLYSWNLLERDAFQLDGTPVGKLDPRQVLDRLFQERRFRPVVREVYYPGVPVWLDPPAVLWLYFRTLRPTGRIAWAALALGLWAWAGRRRMSRPTTSAA